MKHYITRKNEQKTTSWGGGSTTELFIYPHGEEYQKRSFEVRISTAVLNQSPSDFTVLADYHRVLMPLSAELTLDFGRSAESKVSMQACLKPFESVYFEGAWRTISHGICTDFGIMFRDNWAGSLTAADSGNHPCCNGFTCVYALSDNTNVLADGCSFTLCIGDFLVLESVATDKISITADSKTILAYAAKK